MRRVLSLAAVACGICLANPSYATFHLWKVKEVYSNADGSVQFIELINASNGETQMNTRQITATSDDTEVTFTFNSNLSGTTTNKHLLIATPGFEDIPGAVTPDFTLPCGPFFDPNASSITIDFAGVDSITFSNTLLPTDGTNSLTDATPAGTTSLSSGASSPTNFAGSVGAIALTGCLQAGTCEPCDDGLFCTGTESCSGSACIATGACDGICDEGAETCVECNDPSDCNDSNPCTDDDCNGFNECTHTNNTDSCNDGLFCTTTDVCSGGDCVGAGDACPGEQCLEGSDACGDCASPNDCDDSDPCTADSCTAGACGNTQEPDGTACTTDGDFCSGVEECVAGLCVSPGDPCSANQICNESGDTCDPLCGNGTLDSGEECDDANTDDNDGCSSCNIDPGHDCNVVVEPSQCAESPDGGHSHHDHDASSPGGDASAAGGSGNQDASASGDSGVGPGMTGGSSDASVAADGGSGDVGAEGNCNCRVPRSGTTTPFPLLLGFLLLTLWRRTPGRR